MVKPIQHWTDQQLLDACILNDEKAFSQLFDRYFKPLYGFSFSLIKDTEVAKELAMDVMLRLWQKRGMVQAEQGLRAYLFRSIRNAVYNHLRKAQIITQPLDYLGDESHDMDFAADSHLLTSELERLYADKLEEMPEQRRRIFQLSRDENLTYTEIAERMNLSVHTVRNQMSSSLQYFRKHLGDHHGSLFFFFLFPGLLSQSFGFL